MTYDQKYIETLMFYNKIRTSNTEKKHFIVFCNYFKLN